MLNSFLGTGWSFPPAFDKTGNSAIMTSDIEDIEQSIRIILGTIPGERVMQPLFGCDLKRLVFEKYETALIGELNHLIYYALLNYEPRVKFLDLAITGRNEEEGYLQVEIHYSVIITNTRHNMVFPFYFIEGTNVTAANI
jgi:uncharacterized protein